MQAYHVPVSEAPPQGSISLTYRFFAMYRVISLLEKNFSYTDYMYKERECEREKLSNLHISTYILKKKATINF